MDAGIVDVGQRVDGIEKCVVILTAVITFGACGDEVVRVEALDETRLLVNPLDKLCLVKRIIGKTSRLVGNLPGHEGRRFSVRFAGNSVGATYDEAHMIGSQCLGRIVEDESRDILHIFPPAVVAGHRRTVEVHHLARFFRTHHVTRIAHPIEVGSIAARPFPGIVEIKDGLHLTLLEFEHHIVETFEDGVVIDAGFRLEFGVDVRRDSFAAIAANEDADIVDANSLHVVKFLDQALSVAAQSCRTEDGSIPEVGAHIAVFLAALVELAVANGHKWRLFLRRSARSKESEEGEKEDGFFHSN